MLCSGVSPSWAANPHHRVGSEGSVGCMAQCLAHSEHSVNSRHHLLPKEEPRQAGALGGRPDDSGSVPTTASPALSWKYWLLTHTVSLSLSIYLHLRASPHPCMSILCHR